MSASVVIVQSVCQHLCVSILWLLCNLCVSICLQGPAPHRDYLRAGFILVGCSCQSVSQFCVVEFCHCILHLDLRCVIHAILISLLCFVWATSVATLSTGDSLTFGGSGGIIDCYGKGARLTTADSACLRRKPEEQRRKPEQWRVVNQQ